MPLPCLLARHPFSLLSPLHSVRRRGNDNGGGLSSDNAKDIRHLLKMQNIPSEGEKGRERPRLSVMLSGILIAQTSSGSAIRKLPSDDAIAVRPLFVSPFFLPFLFFLFLFLSFFFANCRSRATSNSIDRSGVAFGYKTFPRVFVPPSFKRLIALEMISRWTMTILPTRRERPFLWSFTSGLSLLLISYWKSLRSCSSSFNPKRSWALAEF